MIVIVIRGIRLVQVKSVALRDVFFYDGRVVCVCGLQDVDSVEPRAHVYPQASLQIGHQERGV